MPYLIQLRSGMTHEVVRAQKIRDDADKALRREVANNLHHIAGSVEGNYIVEKTLPSGQIVDMYYPGDTD